ncbi:MBL fold metallo-hydrolase [Gordonia sp. NPDC003376]
MTRTTTVTTERIGHRVIRIPLPIPLRDLREVNCYAIVDDSGITLIDPGWHDAASEAVLGAALADLGAAPTDVTALFVTHAHWDHYTRALDWQQRHGIPVHLGIEERHTIDGFDLTGGPYPQQARLLRRAGAPDLADAVDALDLEDFERDQPFGPPSQWVTDGETFGLGAQTLHAHWTPGHTRGHTVFELPEAGLLFTGDHLLPRITPSLGFEHTPEDSPLTSYLGSLTRFADRTGMRMLPAHGEASHRADVRARELLDHHERRLGEIRQLVADGHHDAATIAAAMTWTRHERRLAELGTVHAMTAILEVRAHLEHLVRLGFLVCDGTGPESYRAAE